MGKPVAAEPGSFDQHLRAIRDVVIDLLAANHCAKDDGSHYGLDVINLSANRARFDLVLTFKAGRAYCCQEAGCHLGPFYRGFWAAIRETTEDRGLRQPPPMRLVRIHTVVEPGAIFRTHAELGLPPETRTFDVYRSTGWSEADATA